MLHPHRDTPYSDLFAATHPDAHVVEHRHAVSGERVEWFCTCGEEGAGADPAAAYRDSAAHIEAHKLAAHPLPGDVRTLLRRSA